MNKFVKECRDKEKEFMRYGFSVSKSRSFVLEVAKIEKGRILEAGTGKGFLAIALAKKGYCFTSIDIDKNIQRYAKAMIKYYKPKGKVIFKTMDSSNMNYSGNAFDCCISINLFHHLKNPKKCLMEMIRVTRRKLVISDFNKKGAALFEKIHAAEGMLHDRTKISFSKMRDILNKNGFKVKMYRKDYHTVLVCQKG